MKKELLKGITEEQIAKAKACKSQDELLKAINEEGITLTDEQLAAVSGGFCSSSDFRWKCTKCGSSDTEVVERYNKGKEDEYVRVHCKKCGYYFYGL